MPMLIMRVLAILAVALLLSLNSEAQCSNKKGATSTLAPIPLNVIEENCGNPELWFQYQVNGRTVKNCEEYRKIKEAINANKGGDPNLPMELP